MFRKELSAINQAGGGVAFGRGGVARFQTGSIVGTQTRVAVSDADRSLNMNRLASLINMVQPILVLEEFEAKEHSVNNTKNTATII